jgi:hypothetical protein
MTRRARILLLAGGALVLAVNAIVLAGVAWNRSGTPDATLRLSERELAMPYYWDVAENSGLALSMRWRLPEAAANWLDAARLEALGFELPPLPDDPGVRFRAPPARQLWLALEFDGPAYARSVQLAEEDVAAAERNLAANPNDEQRKNLLGAAEFMLREVREERTRLVVVDSDRDRGALRARHPDRERYAMVRGRVQPMATPVEAGGGRLEWRGEVLDLDGTTIHVPLAFRAALAAPPGDVDEAARYEVMLAFGRRGEPWIVAALTRPRP